MRIICLSIALHQFSCQLFPSWHSIDPFYVFLHLLFGDCGIVLRYLLCSVEVWDDILEGEGLGLDLCEEFEFNFFLVENLE